MSIRSSIVARLEHVLRIHFDVNRGSPYWLEKQQKLGLTPSSIRLEDLAVLDPWMSVPAERPIEDLFPRLSQDTDYLLAETAGTSGQAQNGGAQSR
jgi:hypothetical protein